MTDKTLYFEIDDATYAYQFTGEGEPIVLLHGFTGTKSTWSGVTEELKSKYQLITIDLPGHGETVIHSPRKMKACCKDLAELFKHLNLTRFHLVGYSLGGRTALSFAMLYSEFILSLILESASPGLKTVEEQVERIKADEKIAQIIGSMGLTSFVDYWENISLFASQKNLSEEQQQMIRSERLAQSESELALSLRMMGTGSQPSWWEKLNELSRPVLLIVGAKDNKFIDINREMKVKLPSATLKIIDEAGHTVHIEKPESFISEVRRFISHV